MALSTERSSGYRSSRAGTRSRLSITSPGESMTDGYETSLKMLEARMPEAYRELMSAHKYGNRTGVDWALEARPCTPSQRCWLPAVRDTIS